MSNAQAATCRSGRHEMTDEADWYVHPSGRRECAWCRKERATAVPVAAPHLAPFIAAREAGTLSEMLMRRLCVAMRK